MPLLGPTSYPATLQSFITHWTAVNARFGAGHELVLRTGLDMAGAVAMQGELGLRVVSVGEAAADVSLARAELQMSREALRARLGQFADLVRAYWTGTPWLRLLPGLPQVTAATDKFLQPCREAARLWALLEAEPAPVGAQVPIQLEAGGTYGLAEFAAQMVAVRDAALALEEALWVRSVALARRDAVLLRVREALMAYSKAVPGRLAAGDALVESMPALWPPPGHTPEAVALTGAWDAAAGAARFSWEASTDKLLDHYELRGCAGDEFDGALEETVARAAGDAPRELTTTELLGRPGAVAAFRLYVVLTTGNERASGTVVVTRG